MAAPVVLRIVREFPWPAERVFDAWLDPATAGRWLFATPHGQMQGADIEARVGGGFRIVDRRDGEDVPHHGEYVEIDRPRRLVFLFWPGEERPADPARITVDIEPTAHGCRLTLTNEMSPEWADWADKTREGWTMILEGLERSLASGQALATDDRSANAVLPPDLMEKLRRLHSGPERGYHSWSHPQALLDLLPEVRDQLHDPLAVAFAIVLHDAIYEPTRTDNEKRSAALAQEMLTGLAPDDTIRRAVRMIEATERHQVPADASPDEAEDCCIFLDMDLSVLGASDAAFDAYEAGVRHEYHQVPEAMFNEGRAAILERFLARDRLYISRWGRDRFEVKARENLKRSLKALRGG